MKVTWESKLDDVAKRQLPFALAMALNKVAKQAAVEARPEAAKRLNIRKKALLALFIRANAENRATKTKLSARVMVGGPKSDPQRGSILAQHEERGTKRPFRGNLVAMPSREITTKGSGKREIKRGYELRNFKPFSSPIDAARNQTPSGRRGSRIEGRRNTFVVFRAGTGMPILLQRFGRGLRQTRALWIWVRQTGLTQRLGFSKSVLETVRKRIEPDIAAEIAKAVQSARSVQKVGGQVGTRLT
jgi:hypothetical protein